MSVSGDLERVFVDFYPYRWVFAVGLMVLMMVSVAFAHKRGWYRYFWSYGVPVSIVAAPALVAAPWLGWALGSPLFTNTTVTEVSLRLLAQKVMLDETTVVDGNYTLLVGVLQGRSFAGRTVHFRVNGAPVASSGTWLQGGGDEQTLKVISILTNTS